MQETDGNPEYGGIMRKNKNFETDLYSEKNKEKRME